ncbi:MAG TPA: autotransporter [Solirubrobacteraceae bacterium]|nr:autotransporter [Solirubrobacteraceae bacterium]
MIARQSRARWACGSVFMSLAAASATWVAGASATGAVGRARVARSQNVTDTAHLHYVRESGSDLLEEGQASGGLPGHVRASLNVGATVYGSFTITTSYGSISGKGSGKLHGTGTYASFGGSMTVTGGTGRFAHAYGHGGFYGVINRNNYAATVQTTGTLFY